MPRNDSFPFCTDCAASLSRCSWAKPAEENLVLRLKLSLSLADGWSIWIFFQALNFGMSSHLPLRLFKAHFEGTGTVAELLTGISNKTELLFPLISTCGHFGWKTSDCDLLFLIFQTWFRPRSHVDCNWKISPLDVSVVEEIAGDLDLYWLLTDVNKPRTWEKEQYERVGLWWSDFLLLIINKSSWVRMFSPILVYVKAKVKKKKRCFNYRLILVQPSSESCELHLKLSDSWTCVCLCELLFPPTPPHQWRH